MQKYVNQMLIDKVDYILTHVDTIAIQLRLMLQLDSDIKVKTYY